LKRKIRHPQLRYRLQLSLFVLAAATVLVTAMRTPPVMAGASTNPPGDAANGKMLFEKRCTGCHSLDLNKEGPRLRGVYGRAAGTAAGFQYSDELKSAHFTWDDNLLDKWLINTDSVVAGNDMDFRVPKPEERADIIAFLRSLSAR
jgi:cytochrome c